MNDLILVKSASFNDVELDCYIEPNQQDKGDFWATRTQIGRLLEYAEPGIAIGKIHQRNQERLDRFSRVHQIDLPSGGSQEVVLYNFKGLLEICRYSQQPKANAVMDWLWEVADEIRRTGSYSTDKGDEELTLRREEVARKSKETDLERAKFLREMLEIRSVPLSEESKAVILHEAFKLASGTECLAMLPPVSEKY